GNEKVRPGPLPEGLTSGGVLPHLIDRRKPDLQAEPVRNIGEVERVVLLGGQKPRHQKDQAQNQAVSCGWYRSLGHSGSSHMLVIVRFSRGDRSIPVPPEKISSGGTPAPGIGY